MASQAQIEANRANALKSTGPRTNEGKAAVAQNAVKHGLLAEQVVIAGEDPGEFEFYRQAMIGELSPVGEVEGMLAERAVGLAWRLRRAERIAAEVFGTLLAKVASAEHMKKMTRAALPQAIRKGMEQADEGQTQLGQAVVRDYANYRVLDRLGLYERRIEKSLFAVMRELERLRTTREFGESSVSTGKTRGLRTHPTSAEDSDSDEGGFKVYHRQTSFDAATPEYSKSEARNSKCETNRNDRNFNGGNEIAPACGSVKAKGLGDGECGFRNRRAILAPDATTTKIQTKPIGAPGAVQTMGING